MAMLVEERAGLTSPVGGLRIDVPGLRPARWLRAGEAIQTSASHPVSLIADLAIVVAASLVTTSTSSRWLTLALLPLAAAAGLYRRRSSLETQGVVWYVRALTVPAAVAAAAAALTAPAGTPVVEAVRGVASAVVGLVLLRAGLWFAVAAARRRGHGLRPTLVSGPAPAVDQVLRRLAAFPECGLRATAVHIPVEQPDKRDPSRPAVPRSGIAPRRALDLIAHRAVDVVLIVSAGGDRGTYDELVLRGEGSGIEYDLVVPLASHADRTFRSRIADLGIVSLGQVTYSPRPMPAKRAFDLVLAAATLLAILPVFALVALAIWLSDRGPILYGQPRVGRNGQVFKMWKFRSMVVGADRLTDQHPNVNNGLLFKVENDPRITRIGAVLRRLSIDELPQLMNVLRGDMSFVGPRPLPVDPDDFDEVAAKRHSVRPGITGPWQVHGGHALTYEDMISLDLSYIAGWSFRRDLLLLGLTIPALVVRRAPVI